MTKKASASVLDTKGLRSEVYVLKMKHAMRELKETHKIKKARQALARHLTKLHNA
jgi:ribosomal protein L29